METIKGDKLKTFFIKLDLRHITGLDLSVRDRSGESGGVQDDGQQEAGDDRGARRGYQS